MMKLHHLTVIYIHIYNLVYVQIEYVRVRLFIIIIVWF